MPLVPILSQLNPIHTPKPISQDTFWSHPPIYALVVQHNMQEQTTRFRGEWKGVYQVAYPHFLDAFLQICIPHFSFDVHLLHKPIIAHRNQLLQNYSHYRHNNNNNNNNNNPRRYSSDEPWPAEQPPLAVFPDCTRQYWVDMWSAHRIPQLHYSAF
jgi:hypothetical protein